MAIEEGALFFRGLLEVAGHLHSAIPGSAHLGQGSVQVFGRLSADSVELQADGLYATPCIGRPRIVSSEDGCGQGGLEECSALHAEILTYRAGSCLRRSRRTRLACKSIKARPNPA